MQKHELRQIIREEIQKATVGNTNYRELAGEMLKLVEEIMDDFLQDYDSEEDKEVIDSINSEGDLIKFYKRVLNSLMSYEIPRIPRDVVKKEVKQLFSKNNVMIK
jgi:phosphate uptake regulator